MINVFENFYEKKKTYKTTGRKKWRLAGDQHWDGGEGSGLPQGRLDNLGGSAVALALLDVLRQLPSVLAPVRPGLAPHLLAAQ